MKKFAAIILTVLIPLSASADFVSSDKAMKIAQSFFAAQTRAQVSQSGLEIVWPQPAATRAYEGIPCYYIINRTDGNGFVIVSAESETPQILAYSNDNAFNIGVIDKGADLFLDYYAEAVTDIRSGQKATLEDGMYTAKQLKTVNFDQSGVFFNDKWAPRMNGQKCMSGCVATAMTIIMKYHNWPPKTSGGYHEYYCDNLNENISFDFNSATFNWKSIPEYPTGKASDELSKIQKACGVAVNMVYDVESSWAYYSLVSYAFRHYFYYDYPIHILRNQYDFSTWCAILMDEINEGRPVFIGGLNEGGHAFVLDGYDSNGIFHYNLGWMGDNNGYYRDDLVAGTYATSEAVIGISPRSTDEEDHYSPIEYSNADVLPTGNITDHAVFDIKFMNFTNTMNEKAELQTRLSVCDRNGNTKCILRSLDEKTDLDPGFYYYFWQFNRVMMPDGISINEDDRFVLSTSADNGKTWQPVYSPNSHFPHYYLGGHGFDTVVVSQLGFDNNADDFTVSSHHIVPGDEFTVTVPAFYNWADVPFEGNLALAICNFNTMEIKYILSYQKISLQTYYGYYWYRFSNVTIPAYIKLEPDDFIGLFTKSKKDTEYRIVDNYDFTMKFMKLQNIMDTDLSVPAIRYDNPESAYTIDGRTSPSQQKGLYIQQFPGGITRKILITE